MILPSTRWTTLLWNLKLTVALSTKSCLGWNTFSNCPCNFPIFRHDFWLDVSRSYKGLFRISILDNIEMIKLMGILNIVPICFFCTQFFVPYTQFSIGPNRESRKGITFQWRCSTLPAGRRTEIGRPTWHRWACSSKHSAPYPWKTHGTSAYSSRRTVLLEFNLKRLHFDTCCAWDVIAISWRKDSDECKHYT